MHGQQLFRNIINMSCQTKAASGKHTATLIFCHGLGDTGHGWLEAFGEVCAKGHKHVKIICPNAPIQSVTLNCGMQMPSWFDIKSLAMDAEEDEAGIIQSSDRLKKMIDDEIILGIPSERIVVGGFSQGGAVGLHTLMTYEKKLAGVIGLSTFLPMHQKFKNLRREENKGTKIFMGHGREDPVIHYRIGEMSKSVLSEYYVNLNFKSYNNLGHSSSPKEMKDVQEWLKNVLPKI